MDLSASINNVIAMAVCEAFKDVRNMKIPRAGVITKVSFVDANKIKLFFFNKNYINKLACNRKCIFCLYVIFH